MKILAHRGQWYKKEEQNSILAFSRSLDSGFGIELDVRDLDGELVIAHDIPRQGAILFKDFLKAYSKQFNKDQVLAINIKSDGLFHEIEKLVQEFKIEANSYFVFDMSVPDTIHYMKRSLSYFVRKSELESENALWKNSSGVWLDELLANWVKGSDLEKLVQKNLPICFVSRELHNREHLDYWSLIKSLSYDKTLICTDYPQELERFLAN